MQSDEKHLPSGCQPGHPLHAGLGTVGAGRPNTGQDRGQGSTHHPGQDLEKTYRTARGALTLFRGLNLEVEAGEMVAILGQSGAGKSTLLHILGALDTPSAGRVYCASTNVALLTQSEAAAFRNREIGYVWQFHYLLPEFTALENVAMPLMARGVKSATRRR